MDELGGLIKVTNDISLGTVILLVSIVVGTCKGVRTIRSEFRKMVFELHEGVMLEEERKIDRDEPSTLGRIIERKIAQWWAEKGKA